MKKIISLLTACTLTFAIGVSLVSCGNNNESNIGEDGKLEQNNTKTPNSDTDMNDSKNLGDDVKKNIDDAVDDIDGNKKDTNNSMTGGTSENKSNNNTAAD